MTHIVKSTVKQPTTIGLDLAKNVMHLHGLDDSGHTLWKKTLKTEELVTFLRPLQPCLIGIEACGGSHYWHRTLSSLDHTVHMISALRVKAFVEGQKNDKNDAAAIAMAVTNPHTRIIPPRTIRQQEIGSLHTMRGLKLKQRTQLINHMRGILNEYGTSCRIGASWFETHAEEVIESAIAANALPGLVKDEVLLLLKDLEMIKARLYALETQLLKISKENPCARLMTIPGIGVLISTMLYAYAGTGEYYKTGRDFAASLGLVPRQYSTGGKQIYGRLSKRGNISLRANLIQGAHTVLIAGLRKRKNGNLLNEPFLEWALKKYDVKGINKAAVAIANKTAKIAWRILKTEGMTFVGSKAVTLPSLMHEKDLNSLGDVRG